MDKPQGKRPRKITKSMTAKPQGKRPRKDGGNESGPAAESDTATFTVE